jgi:two-component system, NarL family, response regulator LiaR
MQHEPIRILIADDHPVVVEGLRTLISTNHDLEIVGDANNGVEAIQQTRHLQPDVLLLDLVMPIKSGLEVIRDLRSEGNNTPIIIMSALDDDENVFLALKAGASGYMLKTSSRLELIQAIYTVHEGGLALHPLIARKFMQKVGLIEREKTPNPALTRREIEVLLLVAKGFSNQRIADDLQISERTVRTHVSNILDKLDLSNRTEATLYALRMGLIQPGVRIAPVGRY